MAKKYHNLAGWMRDVQNAMRDGDEVAYLCAELIVELDDLLNVEPEVEPSSSDDSDYAVDDSPPDVDGDQPLEREADAPQPRGHDAGRPLHSAAPGRMGRQLGDVPGRVGAAAESRQLDLRGSTVGAPLTGLSDRDLMAEVQRRGIRGSKVRRA